MKNRMIVAAIAAFLMLPFFGMTAYATEIDGVEEITVAGEAAETEDLFVEIELFVPEDMPEDEMPIINEAPVTDYPETPPRPFTPSGTGTVIDYATDSDGKVFYTIMTPDEHVFYLVIDKQRSVENVYFLNAVTIADLAVLAELPAQPQAGTVIKPMPTIDTPETPVETPPAPEQTNGGNTGMYIFIGIAVILGGGAGWYFKIYRPKQQGVTGGEEYELPVSDDDIEYPGDWDDEQDDNDDGPPWDEDESGDEE